MNSGEYTDIFLDDAVEALSGLSYDLKSRIDPTKDWIIKDSDFRMIESQIKSRNKADWYNFTT